MKTKFYAKTKLTSLKKLVVPLSRVSTRLKLLVVKPFSGKVPSQIPQPLLWYIYYNTVGMSDPLMYQGVHWSLVSGH